MGYRDKGDRSRERRDRRPPLANWSSAAQFGDATIDQPTPLTGRRDRAARQSDRPARSDAAGWATIAPVEDERDDDPGADRRYSDGDREAVLWPEPRLPRPRRPADDGDAPRRRRARYADDEPEVESGSGSWRTTYDPEPVRGYDPEPVRGYDAVSRNGYDPEPRVVDGPRVFSENPRRSRRALEESARRAVEELARRVQDEEPGLLRIVDSAAAPRALPAGREDDPLDRPSHSGGGATREWGASERLPRHYRDDSGASSWRTRRTSGFETWRTESTSTQTWRSETVSWRSRETTEADGDEPGSVGPRAIGSSAYGADAYEKATEPADLEAWPSETGTWRTRDTATTGSWRLPPEADEAAPPDGDTGEWSTRTTPETGSWSRSRGRWIPNADDTGEQPDFSVRRYDDTGEIPKDLLETARGRVLDQDELYGSDRRRDDTGGRRAAGRRSVDADRFADRDDDRSDGWRAHRSSGGLRDRYDDDAPAAAGSSRTGARGSRTYPAPRSDDLDIDYRDGDAEPRRRPRYPRYDDDAPRYRAGRRGGGGSGGGRHASDAYDDDDERRPTRAVARRTPAYAGPRGVADSVITPRASVSRGELVRVGRRVSEADEDEDDDAQEIPYGYAGAGVASVAWFGLPLGAFLLWAMFLGGTARADCVDAAGRPCPAPRDAAFATFAAHLPQVGVAIVLSVIVAMLIRLATPFWRPATVGFAAAVVGGGVATVLFTVLNSA